MASARFPDQIFCPFVRALCVRLSRVRGFRWLYSIVSVYVCNIPPVCGDFVRLHIRTRIYIYTSAYNAFIYRSSRGEARVHGLLLFHLKGL